MSILRIEACDAIFARPFIPPSNPSRFSCCMLATTSLDTAFALAPIEFAMLTTLNISLEMSFIDFPVSANAFCNASFDSPVNLVVAYNCSYSFSFNWTFLPRASKVDTANCSASSKEPPILTISGTALAIFSLITEASPLP